MSLKQECYFYDDGCGNGGYYSDMMAGPPSCNLSKKLITPNCKGQFKNCELDKNIAKKRSELILTLTEELQQLKTNKI